MRQPVTESMFSDVLRYPRYQLRISSTDPVPRHVGRLWRGHVEQAREAFLKHAHSPFPISPIEHRPFPSIFLFQFLDSDVLISPAFQTLLVGNTHRETNLPMMGTLKINKSSRNLRKLSNLIQSWQG